MRTTLFGTLTHTRLTVFFFDEMTKNHHFVSYFASSFVRQEKGFDIRRATTETQRPQQIRLMIGTAKKPIKIGRRARVAYSKNT